MRIVDASREPTYHARVLVSGLALLLAGAPVDGQDFAPAPVAQRPAERRRSGRGLLAAGGTLLGLGVVGRIAIEGFWVGPAGLEPHEPFGEWSIPGIALFTTFANVLVVPGIVLTGVGAARLGHSRAASPSWRPRPWQGPAARRVGWVVLGTGVGLWAATRLLAVPILHSCPTNACAYGYLESTYWLALGATVAGAVVVGLNPSGPPRVAVTPWLGRHARGLALGGRF